MAQASANISKKRKHVAEGVFKAELDGYLRKVSFLHSKIKWGASSRWPSSPYYPVEFGQNDHR